jgi:ABC-type lipoprotein export system ATPase subunit
MALIELEDVRKSYQLGQTTVEALRGISLSIDFGQYVAIMGPSGSGKTTLLNILGCLDRPSSGRYLLDGQDLTTLPAKSLAKLRNEKFGFVFQHFNLLGGASAVENVELPLIYSWLFPRRRRRELAAGELKGMGLEERAEHNPDQLSGGEQQRVAIARAAVNRPTIIVADAPTANLDAKTMREVLTLFDDLHRQHGLTIVMVTHEPGVARRAHRLLLLRDGQVVKDSTAGELG